MEIFKTCLIIVKMFSSLDRWAGKVAIVTGASSGIGAAIAEQLVSNGIIVAGIARRSEYVEELSKKLSGKTGKLYAVKADITIENQLLESFKWVEQNLGPVHILVNNAGTAKVGSFLEGESQIWKNIIDLNILALCIATRTVVKMMKEHNISGHIININSVVGHTLYNLPGVNVYPATKFAVTALTRNFRQELTRLGTRIKVTSISPGLVETELTTKRPNTTEEERKRYENVPILKSEDIANGVVYVLSTPEHVQILELTIEPVGQDYAK